MIINVRETYPCVVKVRGRMTIICHDQLNALVITTIVSEDSFAMVGQLVQFERRRRRIIQTDKKGSSLEEFEMFRIEGREGAEVVSVLRPILSFHGSEQAEQPERIILR